MTEDDRQAYQDIMKEIMIIRAEVAELQSRLFIIFDKVDEKLNRKEKKNEH